jgi:hypothetical protein
MDGGKTSGINALKKSWQYNFYNGLYLHPDVGNAEIKAFLPFGITFSLHPFQEDPTAQKTIN